MEDQNTMNTNEPMQSNNAEGSKKGLIWVIVLVIVALIIVAFATGNNTDDPDYTDENFISENASDEVADIEADLETDLNLESIDSDLENI